VVCHLGKLKPSERYQTKAVTHNDTGMRAQRAGGTHMLCGPRLLWRLVEQCVVGSVCPRLEQTSSQLLASTRLPFIHLSFPLVQRNGNIHDIPVVGTGARARHGMSVQEGARLSVYDAVAADAFGNAQPNQATQGPRLAWKRGVLDRAICGTERAHEFLSPDLDVEH